jgi:hypothetical protein
VPVAVIRNAALLTIVATVDGATTAAYVGVQLVVATYVTAVSSRTSQALLAELSDHSRNAATIAVRALRWCYLGTIPLALILAALARMFCSCSVIDTQLMAPGTYAGTLPRRLWQHQISSGTLPCSRAK